MNIQARLSILLSLMLLMALGGMLVVEKAFATDRHVTDNPVANNQSVGQATLVIGQALLVNESGRQALKTGMHVHSHDTIVTEANGHVHLRFIDDALVSVRPRSQLKIQAYHYDENHPEQSEVKFDLQSGAARAVSGRAAHAAHDRFRLNTPIAAIGVRGTDFIVSASNDRVRAFVNEGAIVVGAFSDLCQAAALGPCADGTELKGGTQQLLELDRLAAEPRLIDMSLEDALKIKGIEGESSKVQPNSVPADDQSKNDQNDSETSTSPVSDDSHASQPTTGTVDNSRVTTPSEPNAAGDMATDDTDSVEFKPVEGGAISAPSEGESSGQDFQPGGLAIAKPRQQPNKDHDETPFNPGDLAVAHPQKNQNTHDLDARESPLQPDDLLLPPDSSTDSTLPPLDQRQLVWGHWGAAGDQNMADFAFPYHEVEAGRVKLLSSGQYALLRRQGDDPVLLAGLGTVYFDLVEADATFTGKDGSSSAMEFRDGALNINFEKGTFGTFLKMTSDKTGKVSFVATGGVDGQGNLTSKDASGYIRGASSLNGQEAAYLFRRMIDQGYVEGITLWGAK